MGSYNPGCTHYIASLIIIESADSNSVKYIVPQSQIISAQSMEEAEAKAEKIISGSDSKNQIVVITEVTNLIRPE